MRPNAQDSFLKLAQRDGPHSLGTKGLVSINFHRNLDGGQAINLGEVVPI